MNTYSNQRMIMKNGIAEIPSIFVELGCKRYLLVCGNSFCRTTAYQQLKATMPYAVRFSEFHVNPTYEEIIRGVLAYREGDCDGILAVGGGSAIDVAKTIKLFSSMDIGSNCMNQPYVDTKIPLVAVPTTSGTGSESTQFAVLYYEGEKYSIEHSSLLPQWVVLEPAFLRTLPLYQKKSTMMDALCQAIESWWSVNATVESRDYAKLAMEMVLAHWESYLANEEMGNEKMLLAANYAGRAINITKTTAPHAMSYKITSLFGLSHGHAVALCLPKVWRYMIDVTQHTPESVIQKQLMETFEALAERLGEENPLSAVCAFEKWLDALELAPPVGCTESQIERLVSSVNVQRLKNNPIALSPAVLETLYRQIMEKNI